MSCEDCRDIPRRITVRVGMAGAEGEHAEAINRLESAMDYARCPGCQDLFAESTDWDKDHFYPSGDMTLRRLTKQEAATARAELGKRRPYWTRMDGKR